MDRNLNWLGKTGFGLSLVPILTICFWFIQPGCDKEPGVILIIGGSPIALTVSFAAFKLCTKRKWAVSGVIIGGIETLILFIFFMGMLLFFEVPNV